jgi:four helix bundle protein
MQGFRELRVWHAAMDLAESAYRLSWEFPRQEIYGLSSQLQRAAVSVPANIAEGNARRHAGEYLQHVSIARGSLAELETHLELATRLADVTPERAAPLLEQAGSVGRQLTALRNTLSQRVS